MNQAKNMADIGKLGVLDWHRQLPDTLVQSLMKASDLTSGWRKHIEALGPVGDLQRILGQHAGLGAHAAAIREAQLSHAQMLGKPYADILASARSITGNTALFGDLQRQIDAASSGVSVELMRMVDEMSKGSALRAAMDSVSGISQYRDHNVLDELVRRSLALVIDRNLLANADRYGTPQYGSHLERYLVDALRHLAGSNSGWQANREKSRVWCGPDGLFLAWPSAAEDIQKLLDAEQLPGIPKAPETIMEVLLLAGVFEPTSAGNPTWLIQPPGGKAKIETVKLSSAAILFAGHDPLPPPLAESLTSPPRNNPPSAQAAQPVAPRPLPDGPPGTQLSLIPGNAEQTQQTASNRQDVQAEAAPLSTAPPSALASTSKAQTTQQATIGLQAPLRLNPVVRDALTEVVNTLNTGAGPAQCCTVALGVFVPLHEFERRGIQPSMALRALSDVHMLVRAPGKGPPTTSRDFNGTSTVGLTIAPRFISGVDMEAFASPEAQGG